MCHGVNFMMQGVPSILHGLFLGASCVYTFVLAVIRNFSVAAVIIPTISIVNITIFILSVLL